MGLGSRKPRLPIVVGSALFGWVRFLLAWVPAAILIFWSYTYLRTCAQTATAPSAPLRLELETPGGKVTFTAESFAANLRLGYVTVRGAGVTNGTGQRLAFAKRIDLSGLRLTALTTSPLRIRVYDADAILQRDASGKLDFQKYLPPSKPGGKPLPVRVDVDRAALHFVDIRGTNSWRRDVSVTSFHFAGVGSDWVATTGAQIDKVGATSVVAHSSASEGIFVQAALNKAEIFEVVHHFLLTTPGIDPRPYQGLEASSVQVTGPVQLRILPGGGVQLFTDGDAIARAIRYQGFSLTQATWKGAAGQGAAGTKLGGQLLAQGPHFMGSFTGDAALTAKGWSVAGATDARLDALSDLPANVSKLLPKGLTARQLRVNGPVTLRTAGASAKGLEARFEGRASAHDVRYQQFLLPSVAASIRVSNQQIWVRSAGTKAVGGTVTAEGTLNLQNHDVTAVIHARQADLAAGLALYPDLKRQLPGTAEGKVDVYSLVSGTLKQPLADFRIIGTGSYTNPSLPQPVVVQRLLAEGRYRSGELTVARLRLRTPAGTATAFGNVDLSSHHLAFQLDARGLDVHQVLPDYSGLVSMAGTVGGTWTDPSFNGEAEGYDLTYQNEEISLATGDILANRRRVEISEIDVLRGSSQIKGALALDVPTGAISGSLGSGGVQLADLLTEDFAGVVAIRTTQVSGTISDPHISAEVTGTNLLALAYPISTFHAVVGIQGHDVQVPTVSVQVANGTVQGSADYDLDKTVGNYSVTGKGLDLGLFLPDKQRQTTTLQGTASGSATGHFNAKGPVSGSASGTLAGLKLNGTDIGGGVWNVQEANNRYSGSAQASYGLRFLALENGSYDFDSKHLDGDIVVSSLGLQNIYSAVLPYLPADSPSIAQNLAPLDGALNLKAHVNGTIDQVDLAIQDLEANDLKYSGVDFGNLSVVATRTNRKWDIPTFLLDDGVGKVTAKGSVDETGDLALDGEIDNFDLSKLASAIQNGPKLAGSLNASFRASGASASPDIRASVEADRIAYGDQRVDFGLNLDTIEVGKGGIDASGGLTYRGFLGQLQLHVPFAYPFEIPTGEAVSGSLTLAERPLSSLVAYLPSVDPKRLQGTIGGQLKLAGTRDNLSLNGGMDLKASQIGFQLLDPNSPAKAPKYAPLNTELNNLVAHLGLVDSAFTFSASAADKSGGKLASNLSLQVPALTAFLQKFTFPDTDALLASTLNGDLKLTDFEVREPKSFLATSLQIGGGITVAGPISGPLIAGTVGLSNVQSSIPTLTSQGGTGSEAVVNPKFNVQFSLTNPAHISTSLATIDLSGRGRLDGTLSEPNALANLSVVRGQLKLPGGRLSLSPGGSVRASYAPGSDGTPEAHVQVDLLGDGHVTSVRNASVAERYDVHIDVRGDLLSPDQLTYSATSDPPDLSQDQIMALLGRTDLLNSLNGGTSPTDSQRQFATAAIGYALPTLFDPVTSRLATDLGLDYISIEYNALDQTSLLAGKSFGRGFSIQARRQISAPVVGFPQSYDYRLTYRLPVRSKLIRRVTLFAGTDELVPWKVGLEYNIRF